MVNCDGCLKFLLLPAPCDKTCGWNGVWSRSPGGEKKANTDTTRSALHISRPRGCRQAGERLPAIAPRPVPHRSISLLLRRFDARLREAKPTPHVKLFPSRRALLAPSGARAHHLVADGLDHEWVRGLIEAMAASSKPAPDRGDPEEDVGRHAVEATLLHHAIGVRAWREKEEVFMGQTRA